MKPRITKEELAQHLSALPVGEGLEAKFYGKQGAIVVTFEHMESGKTYRIGRNSWKRHTIIDIDTLWNELATEHHLEPPTKKSLTEIILPETRQKMRKEHEPKMTGKERKKLVLEQLSRMEYYTREDVVRMYMQTVAEEQGLQPFEGDKKQLSKLGGNIQQITFFADEVEGGCQLRWERMGERIRKSAGYIPQYYRVISVEPYAMTHAEQQEQAEKVRRIMSKHNYGCFDDSPVNEGRLKAERQNRERIRDYEERKDTFCHGIGQRRVKLFLNRLVKAGDQVARMYRIALEIEGVNLAAKKALMKYHSDYHSYDKKEGMLRELMEVCRAQGVRYGVQDSTVPAATHVIYFELPGCEQISFHTNMHDAATLPAYDGEWDGKKCSTMGKLECAIWTMYEQELRERSTEVKTIKQITTINNQNKITMKRFLSLVAFFSATVIISAQSNNTHPDYMYSISMDSTKVGQMQMTKEAKVEANKNAVFAAGTAIRASADWHNIAIGSGVVAGAFFAIGAGKDDVALKIAGFTCLGLTLVSEVVSIVMKYNAGRSLQIAAGKITYTF